MSRPPGSRRKTSHGAASDLELNLVHLPWDALLNRRAQGVMANMERMAVAFVNGLSVSRSFLAVDVDDD